MVTDLDMPVVDGPTFARSVRQLRPSMKILALSGLEARTSAFSWKDLADDFIPKPFLPAQLVAAVRRLLSTNAIARSPG